MIPGRPGGTAGYRWREAKVERGRTARGTAATLALEGYREAEAARLLPEVCRWTLVGPLRDDWYRIRGCRSGA